MSGETLTVLYKCRCMTEEASVAVPVRRGPSHDVKHWVEEVVAARIAADHRGRVPTCRESTMEIVKIPVRPDEGYVGQGGP